MIRQFRKKDKNDMLAGSLDIFDYATGTSLINLETQEETSNWWENLTNSINDLTNSSLVQGTLAMATDVNSLYNQIQNTINSYSGSVSQSQLEALKQIQSLITSGKLLQTLPAGANANDYESITLGGNKYYVSKSSNLTKWLLIGGGAVLVILILILILKKRK